MKIRVQNWPPPIAVIGELNVRTLAIQIAQSLANPPTRDAVAGFAFDGNPRRRRNRLRPQARDAGELWLQRTVNRTDGAGAVHPDHSLSPIEGPVPCLWTPGEFGWMVADGRLFIGGKLPPKAAACEGELDDGTPMPASADGETWCATIPLNRTADLRFLAKDGTAALECKVVPNYLIAPRPSLLRRVIDLFRPLPKGERTHSGD